MTHSIIELRQYTMHPGGRDALLDLFRRELIAGQEAVGIRVDGSYRDLDRADRFVWMRSFRDLEARRAALTDFYDGPVWKAHREAANATIVDSDDVLLLRPLAGPADISHPPNALLVIEVDGLAGARWYESETAGNDFPRLPVREGVRYAVVMSAPGGAELPPELVRELARPPERLRLESTGTHGARDFDFFMGSWRVRHKRRRDPLGGSDSWYEFDGTSEARPLWGGNANVDECDYQGPTGRFRGATVRLFDSRTGLWRLYWASSGNPVLENPVVGRFTGGRGEFIAHEVLAGRNIFVRFVWSDITPVSCRWEQAFSDDGGRRWETNWIMEFTRQP